MTYDTRNRTARTFAQVLSVVFVIVISNLVVNAVALPHIDLPELPELPDIPGWIGFVLGKGKLIVVAIVIVLAIAGEQTVRRRGSDHGGDGVGDSR